LEQPVTPLGGYADAGVADRKAHEHVGRGGFDQVGADDDLA
jgi:hypothetical protein